jgi:sulfatase maturation enzyme AslB (radical SAM superfamily)
MSNFREISATEIENNLLNLKQLTFEVTDACNLQCKYCCYGDVYYGYDKRKSKCLPTYISFYGGVPHLNLSRHCVNSYWIMITYTQ